MALGIFLAALGVFLESVCGQCSPTTTALPTRGGVWNAARHGQQGEEGARLCPFHLNLWPQNSMHSGSLQFSQPIHGRHWQVFASPCCHGNLCGWYQCPVTSPACANSMQTSSRCVVWLPGQHNAAVMLICLLFTLEAVFMLLQELKNLSSTMLQLQSHRPWHFLIPSFSRA